MQCVIVPVELTEHKAYLTLDPEELSLRSKLIDFWSFYAPGYHYAPAHKLYVKAYKRCLSMGGNPKKEKLPGWDGKIKLFQNGSVPSGLFRATRREAEEELGIAFEVARNYKATPPVKIGIAEAPHLYRHQDECAAKMLRALKYGGGIVLAATRTGKTSTTARFFAQIECSCLFVVDQIELLYQQAEELHSWLQEKIGVVGDQEYQVERVTVATIQTLSIHLKDPKFLGWYKKVKVVVVDELHEALGRRNFKTLEVIKPRACYGLTATLQRTVKPVRLRAYAFAGPVIYEFPLQEGVKRGVLTEGRALQLLFPEEENHPISYQDHYQEAVIRNEAKHHTIKQVTEELLASGRYVMILCERIEHLETLAKMFEDTPHRLAYGKVGKKNRRIARKKFEKGKIRLLIANKVFKKGITIARLDAVIDCAEMRSKNDAQQKYGRGAGLHEDKKDLLYIDIGTQRIEPPPKGEKNRFNKNAKSRARALKAIGIETRVFKVHNPEQAIKVTREWLKLPKPQKLALKQSQAS